MAQRKSSFYGDDLACLHSQHYSQFVVKAAPGVIRMLRTAGVKSGLICDVGCGGGQLSASLLQAGYEVVGVDVSASMIALARKRAPRATFVQSSIAQARLPACDAAVAIGEVFNYLGSQQKMTRAFGNLFRALQPNGVLIFDIIEPPARKLTWTSARLGRDWAVIAEIGEDPGKKKIIRKIHSFRKVGQCYRRQMEVHKQGIYRSAEVAQMLRSTGFRVRTFKGYADYEVTPNHKVFLARKPPARPA
jgi:2-polyprenyl-3-methyl-5-hydroxy-6-metoxy-1,4-benzoquinol methylase